MKFIYLLSLSLISLSARSQDLLSLADSTNESSSGRQYTTGTFKGTRIINGHSVEVPGANELHFLISHRFGTVDNGIYDLFGLDNSTIRLGLEYGFADRLAIGWGRSSLEKTYDGFIKYKILRQSTGKKSMPLSLAFFSSAALNTLRFNADENNRAFSSRLTYTFQLLFARKFSERLSLQFSPTVIHRNFVETREDENDVFAGGIAGRYKINKRIAFTAEYFYVLPGKTADDFENSFSVGFDIETGGHVFQLHFTNAQGMIEKFYIPQSSGRWNKQEIYFGFNISRAFSFGEKKNKENWK